MKGLFDFQVYIKTLREDPMTLEVVEDYEQCYGSLQEQDLTDMEFYQNYLCRFDCPFTYKIPEGMQHSYDWNIFYRFIVGSYSYVSYDFRQPTDDPSPKDMELFITLGKDQQQGRGLHELNFYEVEEIFDFLIIEQFIASINLAEEQAHGLEGASTIASLRQQSYETFQEKIQKVIRAW